jgi:hypothetical protein
MENIIIRCTHDSDLPGIQRLPLNY